VPLAGRAPTVDERLGSLEARGEDVAAARRRFEEGLAASPSYERRWIHGDPHPKNVLTRDGRLAAVIDWGDLAAGDPATDLASVAMLLPRAAHASFFDAYEADQALIARAYGWAAFYVAVLLLHGLEEDPVFERVARQTLARL
jgi:aminoglycoside phosphotransferase (APT) family kinase protein